MSKLLQAAAVAYVLVAAANPAFALNPQPEPPGIFKISKTPIFLPPGPCISTQAVCRLGH